MQRGCQVVCAEREPRVSAHAVIIVDSGGRKSARGGLKELGKEDFVQLAAKRS